MFLPVVLGLLCETWKLKTIAGADSLSIDGNPVGLSCDFLWTTSTSLVMATQHRETQHHNNITHLTTKSKVLQMWFLEMPTHQCQGSHCPGPGLVALGFEVFFVMFCFQMKKDISDLEIKLCDQWFRRAVEQRLHKLVAENSWDFGLLACHY